MTSGNELECVVIQESPTSITVRRGYGTMAIPRTAIASITKSQVLTPDVAPTTRPATGQRIPPGSNAVGALVKEKWATGLQKIPATVIDVGVMKHVPYQSFRCGTDYEVNIRPRQHGLAALDRFGGNTLLALVPVKGVERWGALAWAIATIGVLDEAAGSDADRLEQPALASARAANERTRTERSMGHLLAMVSPTAPCRSDLHVMLDSPEGLRTVGHRI